MIQEDQLFKYNSIFVKEYNLLEEDIIINESNISHTPSKKEKIINTSFNFLKDYSEDLLLCKYYDPKIFTWLIENKSILNINEKDLLWISRKEKNFKADSVLNSMAYRLSKFGKLASSNEILRKLNSDDNEENFKFYEEDSFVVNEDEASEPDILNMHFKKLSTGIFNEERIKRKISEYNKNLSNKKNKKNKMLGKKKHLGGAQSSSAKKSNANSEIVNVNLNETDFKNIDELVNYWSKKEDPTTFKNRAQVIKHYISVITEENYDKNDKDKMEDDVSKIAKLLKQEIDNIKVSEFKFQIITEFEKYKDTKDKRWINIYKYTYKLITSIVKNKQLDEIKNDEDFIDKVKFLCPKLDKFTSLLNNYSDFYKQNSTLLNEYYPNVSKSYEINTENNIEFYKSKMTATTCKMKDLNSENLDYFWELFYSLYQEYINNKDNNKENQKDENGIIVELELSEKDQNKEKIKDAKDIKDNEKVKDKDKDKEKVKEKLKEKDKEKDKKNKEKIDKGDKEKIKKKEKCKDKSKSKSNSNENDEDVDIIMDINHNNNKVIVDHEENINSKNNSKIQEDIEMNGNFNENLNNSMQSILKKVHVSTSEEKNKEKNSSSKKSIENKVQTTLDVYSNKNKNSMKVDYENKVMVENASKMKEKQENQNKKINKENNKEVTKNKKNDSKEIINLAEGKDLNENKNLKNKESKQIKESKEAKEIKDTNDIKNVKETNGNKIIKEMNNSKDSKDSSLENPSTNRIKTEYKSNENKVNGNVDENIDNINENEHKDEIQNNLSKQNKASKKIKDSKQNKEQNDTKTNKDKKNNKEDKEPKDDNKKKNSKKLSIENQNPIVLDEVEPYASNTFPNIM